MKPAQEMDFLPAAQALEKRFTKIQNPLRAKEMEAYMRNQFEFYGIAASPRREALRKSFGNFKFNSAAEIKAMIRYFWEKPQREFQLSAVDLLIQNQRRLKPNFLPEIKYLIHHKSWWDTVDALSSHVLGHLALYPDVKKEMEKWVSHSNTWIKRAALLYQLKYKDQTDWEQLQRFILKEKNSKEFFIQKAIGWVLREYSKTQPGRVKNFVENQKLPPLAVREGLKHLNRIHS